MQFDNSIHELRFNDLYGVWMRYREEISIFCKAVNSHKDGIHAKCCS